MLVEKSVFIPMKAPSQNKFQGFHWAVYYRKYRQRWHKALAAILGRGEHNDEPRRARITIYHQSEEVFYDYANLVGGCKPIPDILKQLGWIKDDSVFWWQCDYRQTSGEDEGTRLELFYQFSDRELVHGYRRSGYSLRQIAREIGISYSKARDYCTGDFGESPGKIKGMDGKFYPAKRR